MLLYNVKEVAEILKTNVSYVHNLRKTGKLQFIKLGTYKVREKTLMEFLEKYEGYDLTDPENIKPLEENINASSKVELENQEL